MTKMDWILMDYWNFLGGFRIGGQQLRNITLWVTFLFEFTLLTFNHSMWAILMCSMSGRRWETRVLGERLKLISNSNYDCEYFSKFYNSRLLPWPASVKAKEEMTFRKRMSFGEGSCRKFSLRTRKPHVKITRLTTYDVCIDTRWIRNYIQSLRELCARQIARISLLVAAMFCLGV